MSSLRYFFVFISWYLSIISKVSEKQPHLYWEDQSKNVYDLCHINLTFLIIVKYYLQALCDLSLPVKRIFYICIRIYNILLLFIEYSYLDDMNNYKMVNCELWYICDYISVFISSVRKNYLVYITLQLAVLTSSYILNWSSKLPLTLTFQIIYLWREEVSKYYWINE